MTVESSLRLCCDDTALFAVVIYLYVQLHTHMQAGEHAHLDLHPHTSTHTVHTPAACPAPAQRSLICVWLLSCGAPLSLLISASAEEVFQETTPTQHCSDLACMSGLFLAAAAACTVSGCSSEQEERKQRILALVHVLRGSGKGPPEVFYSTRPLKTTTPL